ncbi:MAG: Tn3 family transposase [Hymenobacter sp.]
MQDEAYRRRILVQLNRGEGRHAVARAVFHGKKGELRQRYREGMEDQLGALWAWSSTRWCCGTRAICNRPWTEHQATEGAPKPDDLARLSPLLHEHVNMLGRYDFTLPERRRPESYAPLRDLANWREQLRRIFLTLFSVPTIVRPLTLVFCSAVICAFPLIRVCFRPSGPYHAPVGHSGAGFLKQARS